MSTNNTVYSLTNITDVLQESSIRGVMKLQTNQVIRVEATQWKECFVAINEACSYSWRIINSNKQAGDLSPEEARARGITLAFSQQYCCHRAGSYKSTASQRPVQKKSKKVNCACTLRIRKYYAHPEYYELVLEKDHTNHVPGDVLDDIRTLPLAKQSLHEILQQLKHSSKSPRQIRIDMLKAADSFGHASQRKVNYHDIWNLMNKVDKELYHFHKDHMVSFKIWIKEKLPAEGYNCFSGSLGYTQDESRFAFGFCSPDQQNRMKSATSFCLDSTHGISSNIADVLYTLIIRDDTIGRGWPVAYMITNDHSVGPIVEWLQHLRNAQLLVNPQQFTIDCCQTEVAAISNTFDRAVTKIQFCVFHVTQAWNKHLSSVSVPGFSPAENRAFRGEMMRVLQDIVYEEDLDAFHQKIVSFQEEYTDQEAFMNYFVSNWCTEDKFQVWSRSYKERQYSHMLTNNFIESWHNQLKTVFLGRIRNKRLDKLTFVLVNDVEYYLSQEFERVVQGNGAMSPFFKQQRIRELAAEEVDDERRSEMIGGPVDGADGAEVYQVCSFVEGASTGYSVEVTGDKVIASCTCFDYDRRRQPCKHMYLLKMHTNYSVFVSSNTTTTTTTSVETLNVSEPSQNQIRSPENRKLDMAKYCIDINQTIKHFSPDLLKLAEYATEEEILQILDAQKRTLEIIQRTKDKYEVNFRTSNTQL